MMTSRQQQQQRIRQDAAALNSGANDWNWRAALNHGSLSHFPTYSEALDFMDRITARYPSYVQPFVAGQSFEGRSMYAYLIGSRERLGLERMTKGNNNNRESAAPETLSLEALLERLDPNVPVGLITALHHAREPASLAVALYFVGALLEGHGGGGGGGAPSADPISAHILDNMYVAVLPFVNPDGYVAIELTGKKDIRKNRRITCPDASDSKPEVQGVDLNRNYDFEFRKEHPPCDKQEFEGSAPFSEPETQTVQNLVSSLRPKIALNFHSYGGVWTRPFNCCRDRQVEEEVDKVYNEIKFRLGIKDFDSAPKLKVLQYETFGEADDWMLGRMGVVSMSPEVGAEEFGFWPPQGKILSICEETYGQIVAVMAKAGPELIAHLKPGEAVDDADVLSLFNSGLTDLENFTVIAFTPAQNSSESLPWWRTEGPGTQVLGSFARFESSNETLSPVTRRRRLGRKNRVAHSGADSASQPAVAGAHHGDREEAKKVKRNKGDGGGADGGDVGGGDVGGGGDGTTTTATASASASTGSTTTSVSEIETVGGEVTQVVGGVGLEQPAEQMGEAAAAAAEAKEEKMFHSSEGIVDELATYPSLSRHRRSRANHQLSTVPYHDTEQERKRNRPPPESVGHGSLYSPISLSEERLSGATGVSADDMPLYESGWSSQRRAYERSSLSSATSFSSSVLSSSARGSDELGSYHRYQRPSSLQDPAAHVTEHADDGGRLEYQRLPLRGSSAATSSGAATGWTPVSHGSIGGSLDSSTIQSYLTNLPVVVPEGQRSSTQARKPGPSGTPRHRRGRMSDEAAGEAEAETATKPGEALPSRSAARHAHHSTTASATLTAASASPSLVPVRNSTATARISADFSVSSASAPTEQPPTASEQLVPKPGQGSGAGIMTIQEGGVTSRGNGLSGGGGGGGNSRTIASSTQPQLDSSIVTTSTSEAPLALVAGQTSVTTITTAVASEAAVAQSDLQSFSGASAFFETPVTEKAPFEGAEEEDEEVRGGAASAKVNYRIAADVDGATGDAGRTSTLLLVQTGAHAPPVPTTTPQPMIVITPAVNPGAQRYRDERGRRTRSSNDPAWRARQGWRAPAGSWEEPTMRGLAQVLIEEVAEKSEDKEHKTGVDGGGGGGEGLFWSAAFSDPAHKRLVAEDGGGGEEEKESPSEFIVLMKSTVASLQSRSTVQSPLNERVVFPSVLREGASQLERRMMQSIALCALPEHNPSNCYCEFINYMDSDDEHVPVLDTPLTPLTIQSSPLCRKARQLLGAESEMAQVNATQAAWDNYRFNSPKSDYRLPAAAAAPSLGIAGGPGFFFLECLLLGLGLFLLLSSCLLCMSKPDSSLGRLRLFLSSSMHKFLCCFPCLRRHRSTKKGRSHSRRGLRSHEVVSEGPTSTSIPNVSSGKRGKSGYVNLSKSDNTVVPSDAEANSTTSLESVGVL